MDNYLIPHIYHFFNIEKDFEMKYYHYFSLKSLLEINDSINIHFYYYYLPKGKFWDKLIKNNEDVNNNKIILKQINIPAQYTNIDEYLKARKDFYYGKIYIVFVNKFIEQYNFLNNYNKNLLTVMINNQDALIKNSYVVLPTD